MTVFGLVHGAWHGSWCWEPLVRELEARGYAAVAADLPSDDPEVGCGRYAEVVVESLRGVGDQVVVVGHSLGGLTIPLVAAARPVERLVYLCGFVPRPGRTPWALDDGEPSPFEPGFSGYERDELGRSYWPDPEIAVRMMYADCDPEDAYAAASRLRPQGPLPNTEPCPLEALPAVPATMVLTTEDASVSPAWVRWTAAHRLAADVFELPGGHSPMLARPAALAAILAGLA